MSLDCTIKLCISLWGVVREFVGGHYPAKEKHDTINDWYYYLEKYCYLYLLKHVECWRQFDVFWVPIERHSQVVSMTTLSKRNYY